MAHTAANPETDLASELRADVRRVSTLLVDVPQSDAAGAAAFWSAALGVPAMPIGVTGGNALILPSREAISVAELKAAHESWLPSYMAGKAA